MPESRLEVDSVAFRYPRERIAGAAYQRTLVWTKHRNGQGPRVVLDAQWRSVKGNTLLKIAPGKHTVRYGWASYHTSDDDPTRIDKKRPVVLWTGEVEIEIIAARRSHSDENASKDKEQLYYKIIVFETNNNEFTMPYGPMGKRGSFTFLGNAGLARQLMEMSDDQAGSDPAITAQSPQDILESHINAVRNRNNEAARDIWCPRRLPRLGLPISGNS